ncbi:hypothetical protein GCM10025868_07880 [Angustibacter aerolatus]|uniref:Uncharacterized protein n=1 Tax=Angustibacter aerolatus TaxID=1162965 RepID=A0ABQ6JBJ8_9ACTN|nr:hypothetical protein GCM10025868_07880 [Angustibacter aerolatus]
MVGESGVSSTCAAGASSSGSGSGTTVVTASTLAAYPPGERTYVSSPTGDVARNSSDAEPPIAPDTACTIT